MLKRIVGILLFAICFLSSCGPSLDFQIKNAQGLYPDASDFPDTKWVCREVDMYFYMFDHGDSTMAGVYTVDGKEYRVTIGILYADMSFEFYSHTDVSESLHKGGYVTCERNAVDFLATEYIYENGIITCKIRSSGQNIWNYKGDTITFEKVGSIAEESGSTYYCEDLNMSLTKIVDGYYKGEIVIDNISNYVHAIEVGNSGYYRLSIENGEINNLKKHTVYPFVNMVFEQAENKIIATVSDECLYPIEYPYWKNDKVTFVFAEN